MKILEKLTLIIYSNIILILSIILCLLVFGWLDTSLVGGIVNQIIAGEVSSKILLGISIVFILLSIRCIFFDSTSKEQIKEREYYKELVLDEVKDIKEIVIVFNGKKAIVR